MSIIIESVLELVILAAACWFINYLINVYRDIKDGINNAVKKDKAK